MPDPHNAPSTPEPMQFPTSRGRVSRWETMARSLLHGLAAGFGLTEPRPSIPQLRITGHTTAQEAYDQVRQHIDRPPGAMAINHLGKPVFPPSPTMTPTGQTSATEGDRGTDDSVKAARPHALVTHTTELVEHHYVHGWLSGDLKAERDRCADAMRAWCDAHGVEPININVSTAMLFGGETAYVSWDVVVGKADVHTDQRIPGDRDEWIWSARAHYWADRLPTPEPPKLASVTSLPFDQGGLVFGPRDQYGPGMQLGDTLTPLDGPVGDPTTVVSRPNTAEPLPDWCCTCRGATVSRPCVVHDVPKLNPMPIHPTNLVPGWAATNDPPLSTQAPTLAAYLDEDDAERTPGKYEAYLIAQHRAEHRAADDAIRKAVADPTFANLRQAHIATMATGRTFDLAVAREAVRRADAEAERLAAAIRNTNDPEDDTK